MAAAAPSHSRKRPSDRTIAFAVSIVLSKPEELTVREYIQLLRQHVAKGRRENAISSAYGHLDRSSFWCSEYERLKDALKVMEGENVDLQREIDALKEKLEKPKPNAAQKKRKKPDEDVVPVPRSPKKLKQDGPFLKRPATIHDSTSDFNFSDIGEVGNILMRSFYQVHALLRSHNKTEPLILAHHLVRAASALPQVVQRTLQQCDTDSMSDEFLRSILHAASRSVALLLTGCGRLTKVADGAEVRSNVTYTYVQMYGKLAECLETISVSEVRRSATIETTAASEKKQSTSKSKGKQPKPQYITGNVTLNMVSNFLCSIIDMLDSKSDAHNALFEGFAYVVLNKLGPRLYLLVFGHGPGPTIEDEIAVSNEPDEIEDDAEYNATQSKDLQLKAARLEAPYLIHLLTRIMNAAPVHLGVSMSSKTGKAKQTNNKGTTKGALAINAKERLQRTLVDCMFGSEGTEEDDPFVDCLKMPATNGPALPLPKIKEADVQDWFKEEVWRLLGWEILSREGDQ